MMPTYIHTDRSGPTPVKTEFHFGEQEIYKIKARKGKGKGKNINKWYWTMIAENGKKVADGSQGYSRKWNAEAAGRRIVAAKIIFVETNHE